MKGRYMYHDDVIKWKHFPRNWPFVRGIHRSRWIPRTKASDAELWCFFDLRLNKRLSKQSWGWWFGTLSSSLWRQCNVQSGVIITVNGGVIKWKHFPRTWPFVWGFHRSPVNSPHKGQWRRALIFSLICSWINGWVNNGDAGDLICHRAHFDVTVMSNIKWYYKQHCSSLYSQKSHRTSPSRATCGVSFMRILKKTDRVIMATHCISSDDTVVRLSRCETGIMPAMAIEVGSMICSNRLLSPPRIDNLKDKSGFTILMPEQKDCHLAQEFFFLAWKTRFLFQFRLSFFLIKDNPGLVLMIAWRRIGEKLISEPKRVSLLSHECFDITLMG